MSEHPGWEAVDVREIREGDHVRMNGIEWDVTSAKQISAYMVRITGDQPWHIHHIAFPRRIWRRVGE